MPKYLWKCLIKLFWLFQGSQCGWSSFMMDKPLKMPRVGNNPGFWIWHGCICKRYTEFRICMIMAPYISIMPEYDSICLNVQQYIRTRLNITECLWICVTLTDSGYARVLDMLRQSYDHIIIIVTNVIILEFLSAQCVHPGALLPLYLFLTPVRT